MTKSADSYLDAPKGKSIFAEGDKGQTMYIVESGCVELFLAERGKDAIAVVGPGEFFGEAAMFEDGPRFCSAIAREPSRLLKVERAVFADLLRQNADIALKMMNLLVRRQQQCELNLTVSLAELSRLRRKPAAPAAAPTVESKPKPEKPAPARAPVPAAPAAAEPAAAPVAKTLEACVLRHAQGESFALDPAISEFLIGRPDPVAGINPEINLTSVDPTRSLSRRHAKLIRQGRLFFVREEAATVNGTFVNNVRVATGQDIPIKPGDKLRFGAVEVEFAAA